MNILLIQPRTPDTFWSFHYALRFIAKRSAFPPLGLLTVAAMLPESWKTRLADLNVSRLRDADIQWADYVMISAMIVHNDSALEIIARCKSLSRPVIAGGPLFTTGHEEYPGVDHFVLGEVENLMPRVIADMRAGTMRRLYQTDKRPDIAHTPIPRWDLIDPKHYASMAVQFSRGCPYDCEFCDIVVMNGRVPRTKDSDQMIDELEAMRIRGWKGSVFLVDDNFIGNKRRVKELLRSMIAWRRRTGTRMDFFTEASVNLADDPELLELMVAAGFKKVFLGIETPVLESLKECHKVQNTKCDLSEAVKIIQSAGMAVMGGFIVGFDNDTPDIFERQFEFIQNAGVVTAMVGLLNALPKTQLYQRLLDEGRMLTGSTGNNTEAFCNFIPKLDSDFLVNGYRHLMRTLYEPRVYYERVATFLRQYRHCGPRRHFGWADLRAFVKSIWLLGFLYSGRRAFWRFLAYTMCRHPRKLAQAVTLAIYGHHFRRVASSM